MVNQQGVRVRSMPSLARETRIHARWRRDRICDWWIIEQSNIQFILNFIDFRTNRHGFNSQVNQLIKYWIKNRSDVIRIQQQNRQNPSLLIIIPIMKHTSPSPSANRSTAIFHRFMSNICNVHLHFMLDNSILSSTRVGYQNNFIRFQIFVRFRSVVVETIWFAFSLLFIRPSQDQQRESCLVVIACLGWDCLLSGQTLFCSQWGMFRKWEFEKQWTFRCGCKWVPIREYLE